MENLLYSDNMVKDIEFLINENPDSLPPYEQYNSSEDPEYNNELMKESFYKGYIFGDRLQEANFNLKRFIREYIDTYGVPTLEDLAAALQNEKAGAWYKKNLDKLEIAFNEVLAKLDKKSVKNIQSKYTVNDLSNELAKELATAHIIDNVMSAKESAADKFHEVYNLAASILTGRGIKHHGFIFGDPGIGKCLHYDTEIKIKVDDSVIEEFCTYISTEESDIILCKLGQLYDFISIKTEMAPLNEFTKIPFRVEIENEDGYFVSCPEIIMKESPLYKVVFKNKYELKGADKHILYLNKFEGIFLKDLKSGFIINYGTNDMHKTDVVSVKKISEKEKVYSLAVNSNTHLYRDAAGFLHHNTFSVKQAMKYEFPKGGLATKGYKIQFDSGDVGRSPSAIVAYFYKNREKKIIVLDDCDGFILAKDQSVQNLLKAMLDLDNTEANPKYITVSASIRKLAGKMLSLDEQEKIISIDQKKLKENILSVSVNGENVLEENISDEERAMFREESSKRKKESHKDDLLGLGLLNEVISFEDDDEIRGELSAEDLDDEADIEEIENETNDVIIPPQWRFTSRMIMISNLRKEDVNDAVLSRTDSYGLTLTREEFMARLGEILPNLLTDVETETSKDMIEYAKKAAYAYLCAAIELDEKGQSVNGKRVKITAQLQFRVIAEIAGKWLQRADSYALKNGINITSVKDLDKINNAIKIPFFIRGVIPTLEA